MSEAPKDGLSRIVESTIQFPPNSSLTPTFEPRNNTTLNGKDKRMERHHEEKEEDGYEQKTNIDLSKQIESEIGVVKGIMRKLKKKKKGIRNLICRYAKKDLNMKPRNNVILDLPSSFNGLDMGTIIHSEPHLMSRILASSSNFPLHHPKDSLSALNRAPENSPLIENIYATQLKLLLSSIAKSPPTSYETSQRAVFSLLNHDFASYTKTTLNPVIPIDYSYDFAPPNPLLILASRLNFTTRAEEVVRYISRKRRTWREVSGQRYEKYKKEFESWKRRKTEPEVEDNTVAVKKVDIYGHESPLIIPKSASILPCKFYLESPVPQRKATLDFDPNTCKLISEIC